MWRRVVVWMLGVGLALSGCDASDPLDLPTSDRLCSIQYLKSLCTRTSVPVTSAVVIRGQVVANDCYGECNRALILQDDTGGILLHLNQTHLDEHWPFGAWVKVYCNGLTLHNSGGRIELGYDPDQSGFGALPAARISLHLRRDDATEPPLLPTPRPLAIDQLTPYDIDTYVCISSVRFMERGSWCDPDPEDPAGKSYLTTERTVQDTQGNTLMIRTSGLCSYASEPLPEGEVDLYGTVDYFSGTFSLRIINHGIIGVKD